MKTRNRDDFTEATKIKIAKQAGWHCSDPHCRRLTIGANSTGDGIINLGTAAHICAAAPGGPRYDPQQTQEQRRSADNGIWMCTLHGKAVDAKDSKYTIKLLHEWKARAHRESWRRVLYNDYPNRPTTNKPTDGELSIRLIAAAAADLEIFRRSAKWPSTTIDLSLKVAGLDEPVGTAALATALKSLDDIILVAPPGTGKTATCFQIAEATLSEGNSSPIVVPLGDWSTDSSTLFEFILRRPAYRGISEDELRIVASQPGVLLLLDGWNELDAAARKRLRVQIGYLQSELPLLSLLISTRAQALDVPINGTRANLLPLSETQQLNIAKALRGDEGARMVDQAWRTDGIQELVSIPLYLITLLALPEDTPFPTTKEEIIRCFVDTHENDAQCAEALAEMMYGLHQRFLEDLAVNANLAQNTSIPEPEARKTISNTANDLVKEGQLTEKPQPILVLETLVSYHLLLRANDPAGYSFQHQQFQEWYASHFAERLIISSMEDNSHKDKLKADILNCYVWEESILFACERLAHGDQIQQKACSATILAAFEVDPMLAAEMIFRSTDTVWALIGTEIHKLIENWHSRGKVDRAFRFMIKSGRHEFFNMVWPLITHDNDQVHLGALRAHNQFRVSILGKDAAKHIASLSSSLRESVIHEIAFNGTTNGLNLVADVAKNDPDPEIKTAAIDAFVFRQANRHIVEVLGSADEKTYNQLAKEDLLDYIEVDDESINLTLHANRDRLRKQNVYERLRTIVYGSYEEDLSGELARIIREMDFRKHKDKVPLIYEANNRYPSAVAEGLLQHVRADNGLPSYGDIQLLASAGLALENEELFKIVLSDIGHHTKRPEAAASLLGPRGVALILEEIFAAKGDHPSQPERYYSLLSRIKFAPFKSLIEAIRKKSPFIDNEKIAEMAKIICHHHDTKRDAVKLSDDKTLAAVIALTEEWSNRLLASSKATRSQLASIAELISRISSKNLLAPLKQLLDEEIKRYFFYKKEAEEKGWRQGQATNEARIIYTNFYQQAFMAINAPETNALMREYLQDVYFGECAARVLAARWFAANEIGYQDHFWNHMNLSLIKEKRATIAKDPTATALEADAIFSAIHPLIVDGATKDQKRHAISLGIIAARLPHGQHINTIRKLLSLAPHSARAIFLKNLAHSGEIIDIEMVKTGIAEVFAASTEKPWILFDDSCGLREWLSLLPFVNRPAEIPEVFCNLPEDLISIDLLKTIIPGLGLAPGDDVEEVLFLFAENFPKLYMSQAWRDAVMRRGTLTAARRLVDLTAGGAFEKKEPGRWTGRENQIVHFLVGMIQEHPELRMYVYQLLQNEAATPGLTLIAQAIAESPDVEGLLLLCNLEIKHKKSFISYFTIINSITEKQTCETWTDAYDINPVPADELRKRLLAMTTDGGSSDIAANILKKIDEIRDEYGSPQSEPRHPDIVSGKSWPIISLSGGNSIEQYVS